MSQWLGWVWLATSFGAVPSVARLGEAPDDGPGVHVLVGMGAEEAGCSSTSQPPPGELVDLGLADPVHAPQVRQLGSQVEARVCAPDGRCEVARGGTVVLESAGPTGVRGTYELVVGERRVEGVFDAHWCGSPPPPVWSLRPAVPVERLPELAGRQGHAVFVRGTLAPGGTALAGGSGASVPLRLEPATMEAVAGFTGEVEVTAHVDHGVLVADTIQPAPGADPLPRPRARQ